MQSVATRKLSRDARRNADSAQTKKRPVGPSARPSTKPCRRSFACRKRPAQPAFSARTRFPCAWGRGRGNVQGNLAAQGFRTRRACRRVRIAFGGLRPSKPPQRGLSLRMAQEGACRPFLHPRRSVFHLSIRCGLPGAHARDSPAAPIPAARRPRIPRAGPGPPCSGRGAIMGHTGKGGQAVDCPRAFR